MAVEVKEADILNPVRVLDRDEEWAFFDDTTRALLGIGGEEFVRRWNAGDYDDIADDPAHSDIMYLAMLGDVGR